jgi:hypothetical protein
MRILAGNMSNETISNQFVPAIDLHRQSISWKNSSLFAGRTIRPYPYDESSPYLWIRDRQSGSNLHSPVHVQMTKPERVIPEPQAQRSCFVPKIQESRAWWDHIHRETSQPLRLDLISLRLFVFPTLNHT